MNNTSPHFIRRIHRTHTRSSSSSSKHGIPYSLTIESKLDQVRRALTMNRSTPQYDALRTGSMVLVQASAIGLRYHQVYIRSSFGLTKHQLDAIRLAVVEERNTFGTGSHVVVWEVTGLHLGLIYKPFLSSRCVCVWWWFLEIAQVSIRSQILSPLTPSAAYPSRRLRHTLATAHASSEQQITVIGVT